MALINALSLALVLQFIDRSYLDSDHDAHADLEGEGAGVSAAASGQPGPPPMAVALVSSLFTSEPHPCDRAKQLSGTHVSTKGFSGADTSRTGSATSPLDELSPAAAPSPQPYPSNLLNSLRDSLASSSHGMLEKVLEEEAAASSLPQPADPEGDDEVLFSEDEYAGGWHRPAKFGDAADKNKQYYQVRGWRMYSRPVHVLSGSQSSITLSLQDNT